MSEAILATYDARDVAPSSHVDIMKFSMGIYEKGHSNSQQYGSWACVKMDD